MASNPGFYFRKRSRHSKNKRLPFKVPDRWEVYDPIGDRVGQTRFICFKAPLNENICRKLKKKDEAFGIDDLFRLLASKGCQLGLVIDLTCTTRYYDPKLITYAGIEHVKVSCPGQGVPPESKFEEFALVIKDYEEKYGVNDELLIGVHDTHGVNRVGYMVCRYMIEKMGYEPSGAIMAFNVARGHPIEKQEYINALFLKEARNDPPGKDKIVIYLLDDGRQRIVGEEEDEISHKLARRAARLRRQKERLLAKCREDGFHSDVTKHRAAFVRFMARYTKFKLAHNKYLAKKLAKERRQEQNRAMLVQGQEVEEGYDEEECTEYADEESDQLAPSSQYPLQPWQTVSEHIGEVTDCGEFVLVETMTERPRYKGHNFGMDDDYYYEENDENATEPRTRIVPGGMASGANPGQGSPEKVGSQSQDAAAAGTSSPAKKRKRKSILIDDDVIDIDSDLERELFFDGELNMADTNFHGRINLATELEKWKKIPLPIPVEVKFEAGAVYPKTEQVSPYSLTPDNQLSPTPHAQAPKPSQWALHRQGLATQASPINAEPAPAQRASRPDFLPDRVTMGGPYAARRDFHPDFPDMTSSLLTAAVADGDYYDGVDAETADFLPSPAARAGFGSRAPHRPGTWAEVRQNLDQPQQGTGWGVTDSTDGGAFFGGESLGEPADVSPVEQPPADPRKQQRAPQQPQTREKVHQFKTYGMRNVNRPPAAPSSANGGGVSAQIPLINTVAAGPAATLSTVPTAYNMSNDPEIAQIQPRRRDEVPEEAAERLMSSQSNTTRAGKQRLTLADYKRIKQQSLSAHDQGYYVSAGMYEQADQQTGWNNSNIAFAADSSGDRKRVDDVVEGRYETMYEEDYGDGEDMAY